MPFLRALLIFLLPLYAFAQPYFPVPPVADADRFMTRLPGTAYRLTNATSAQPREVRVLVYGQSISMQEWWQQVKRFLEKRYPEARLIMVNKAIGGFSSERLKLMVDNDVVSFYPDLILFHDYGNEEDYEFIIRTIRSRTTAEVAVQTDHIAVGQNEAWHDRHCAVWLPALCDKYQLALIDIRKAWKAYLAKNGLSASSLLKDNVHLNAHGNYLMAEIIARYFETLTTGPVSTDDGRVLTTGKDFVVRKDRLRLSLTGNRVDLVWNSSTGSASVLVDGQKPSATLGCYYHTRPSRQPDGFFLTHIGQALTVRLAGQPQAEDWTLTITAVDSVRQEVGFRVSGSKTGHDGEGSSDTQFTSRSGRIVIEPQYWFRRKSPGDFRQFAWLKPGDTLRWQVVSMCRDTVSAANEQTTTIVQGVANGGHVVELSGRALSGLRAVSVYQPPLRE